MMVKYLLFKAWGNRGNIKAKIEGEIYPMGVGREVESLKFEGGNSREFYLGIGINLEDPAQKTLGQKLEGFVSAIGLTPLRDMNGSCFFDERKISSDFLKENFEYDSFLEPIKFEPIGDGPDDGFLDSDLFEPESTPDGGNLVAMDRILWWMSSKGEAAMPAFRDAASLLFPDYAITQAGPWGIMRKLILLGYVETDGDGRWGMVPTTTVRTAHAGLFLTGKVTPRVVRLLDRHMKSSSNGGPTRIGFASEPMLAGATTIDDPASAIASSLPDFGIWLDSLRGDPDIEPHRYELKLYDGRLFNEYEERPVPPGFYEVERIEGATRPKKVLFDGRRWIGGGYYDLRWSAKKIGGSAMEVWVDGEGRLLIPEAERWPMLYERPLVLSSGRLPEVKNIGGQRVLAYESVGKEVALILAGKLGIKLKEV